MRWGALGAWAAAPAEAGAGVSGAGGGADAGARPWLLAGNAAVRVYGSADRACADSGPVRRARHRCPRLPGSPGHPPWLLRSIGAAVESVCNRVTVGVLGAAIRIDQDTGRRIRALVDAIGDVVVIGVSGASARVHDPTGGRVRAAIESVGHAIVCRCPGATGAIDLGTFRVSPQRSRLFGTPSWSCLAWACCRASSSRPD